MRALGIDLGSKRVGIAVGDTDIGVATPSDVLERDPARPLEARLGELVEQWEVEVVVVGLPRSLDGSQGPAERRARDEAEVLASSLDVPVELHDERLSTVTAQSSLHAAGVDTRRGRKVVDAVAASVILQSWLDVHRNREP